ncbi:hypothetical protein [Donghicola eburneus]|uniref:hypothetical protein n=1 Tax=Donghicola eburneus TaxID=393278 RepID=UPI0008E1B9CB|nr:hypothetical protein [Donghicola eburneus]SFQ75606.1 hypothetical protein SAMN05421764_11633 [Donghicola eburneus]
MGYSQPKKQLDLKDFLSTPAKKRPTRGKFGDLKRQAVVSEQTPASETKSDKKAT